MQFAGMMSVPDTRVTEPAALKLSSLEQPPFPMASDFVGQDLGLGLAGCFLPMEHWWGFGREEGIPRWCHCSVVSMAAGLGLVGTVGHNPYTWPPISGEERAPQGLVEAA